MSCLGPNYLPNPPREWNRYSTSCTSELYVNKSIGIQNAEIVAQQYKGNILQYKKNSFNITQKQRYAQISKGMWTNRTTSWASQTETYTQPNTKSLKRIGAIGTITEDDLLFGCPQPLPPPDNKVLPIVPVIDIDKSPIIPPSPGPIPPSPYIPPPPKERDFIPNIIMLEGGFLVCNVIEDRCTGELIKTTANQTCFPTSDSDVPGKIRLLCYNPSLPDYYPKVKRTYGTSGSKWPVNSKFIR
jgi:hypothetical protein